MTFLIKDIADQLATSTNIANAVSNRIYPERIPQQVTQPYPCLVIGYISAQPEFHLRGEAGLHTTQIQIDVYTDGTGGISKANEIAELVRNRLSGYRGTFGTGSYGTSRLIRPAHEIIDPYDGSDQRTRRVSMDFEIIHTADVPTLT